MRRLILIPLLLLADGAAAQNLPAVAVGVEAGPAIPLGEFADDGAKVGWGVGASATVRLSRLLGAYLSWEQTRFDVEGGPSGATRWTDSGLGAGARLWLPAGNEPRIQPWAQLGLGWRNADRPLAGGPAFDALDTDGIPTLEGGAGVDIAVARQRLLLRPAVRYRRYRFTVESPTETSRATVSYLTLAVGLVLVVPALD